MSERSLVTIYQELLQTQGFAAAIDADGLVWFTDCRRARALIPAEDVRQRLQLIWRSEPLPADATLQQRSAAHCLAVRRSSGGKAYLEHGWMLARVDRCVRDIVYLPELFNTALAALQAIVTLLSTGPDRPADHAAAGAVRHRPAHAADWRNLRALYRLLLHELGCHALNDLPGALMFERHGGPYVLMIDETRPQHVELSFTTPHAARDAERQRVAAIWLEINRQKPGGNVTPDNNVTARSASRFRSAQR